MSKGHKIKPHHEGAYMNAARGFAALSKAVRLQVGAVAGLRGAIIAEGFNGQPPGEDNCCEDVNDDGTLSTKSSTRHAELNLVLSLARGTQSADGCTVYLTHAPCVPCAHLLKDVGVYEVVYENEYRDTTGLEVLRKAKVKVRKFKPT